MEGLKAICALSLIFLCLTVVQGEQCGSKNCAPNQVCEKNDNTCYNQSQRINCQDGIFYCYKPRQCCGVGTCCPADSKCCGLSTCCPADSKCCGLSTCCPKGAVCCGEMGFCCEAGSTCCGYQRCCASEKNATFHWWALAIAIGVVVPAACLGAYLRNRRRRRAEMLAQGGVILQGPAGQIPQPAVYPQPSNPYHHGYNQGNDPPAYSDAVNPRA